VVTGFANSVGSETAIPKGEHFWRGYPPGDEHIPLWEKKNHLKNAILGGHVSFLEGIFTRISRTEKT